MNSNIDQEVIDELIAMLEDHIAVGLKKPDAAMPAEPEAEEIPGVEASETEAPAAGDEDEEDMKKLMEMYSKG